MFRFISFFLFISFSFSNISAQQEIYPWENTFSNITGGIYSSLSYTDIPVGLAFLYKNNITSGNIGDKIMFCPYDIERSLSDEIGDPGRFSIGSIDKDLFPNTYFFGKLITTSALDLFTNVDVGPESYQRIFLFQKSLFYTYTITELVKNLVNRTRPDGSDNRSFFSGHTSTTFAAATFIYKELIDVFDEWHVTRDDKGMKFLFKTVSFSALYGWAGYVGYSRIRDKKHYLSDVLVGAAAGTIISYLVYNSFLGKNGSLFNGLNLYSGRDNILVAYRFSLN